MQTFKMADVGEKAATHRVACAFGRICMSEEAFNLIKQNRLPKGNPLPMAETAGILAVKKTSEILPLCHPLALEKIEFQFELKEAEQAVEALCTVSAHGKTGVEMEALMGVQVALLTIYDLTKPVDPALTMTDIRLKSKQGGKKGSFTHPHFSIGEGVFERVSVQPSTQKWNDLFVPPFEKGGLGGILGDCKRDSEEPPHFKNNLSFKDLPVAVLTVSDRASRGEYVDESGNVLKQILKDWGVHKLESGIVPDEKNEISSRLLYYADELKVALVITTGGTGLSKRDNTPEVVTGCCDRVLPGLGELLRKSGSVFTPYAWLSRAVAGVRNNTLMVTLPGSPKAVHQGLEALKIPLLHAVSQLKKCEIKLD